MTFIECFIVSIIVVLVMFLTIGMFWQITFLLSKALSFGNKNVEFAWTVIIATLLVAFILSCVEYFGQ